ncbi:hypothetical protein ACRRTK_014681 [Alexandromys fortis]
MRSCPGHPVCMATLSAWLALYGPTYEVKEWSLWLMFLEAQVYWSEHVVRPARPSCASASQHGSRIQSCCSYLPTVSDIKKSSNLEPQHNWSQPGTPTQSVSTWNPNTIGLNLEPNTENLSLESNTDNLSLEPNADNLSLKPNTENLNMEPNTENLNLEPNTGNLNMESNIDNLNPESSTDNPTQNPNTNNSTQKLNTDNSL